VNAQPKFTAEQVARLFNVPLANVQRHYARIAVELRQMEATARKVGKYRGFTASQLSEFAAHAEQQAKPSQTMREFFAREDVKELQEIQKRNHPDSIEHREATAKLRQLGEAIGAGEYFD